MLFRRLRIGGPGGSGEVFKHWLDLLPTDRFKYELSTVLEYSKLFCDRDRPIVGYRPSRKHERIRAVHRKRLATHGEQRAKSDRDIVVEIRLSGFLDDGLIEHRLRVLDQLA